jgi:hypothetical protein
MSLDIIHRPVSISKHVLETGFYIRLEVKPTLFRRYGLAL